MILSGTSTEILLHHPFEIYPMLDPSTQRLHLSHDLRHVLLLLCYDRVTRQPMIRELLLESLYPQLLLGGHRLRVREGLGHQVELLYLHLKLILQIA